MKSQHIEMIPTAEIRIVNPRSRNRMTFRSIVNNIHTVGLKKPITVFERAAEADGTKYDLVCGQGRLEAVMALGSTRVPAIVTDAPLDERYLMSLIENVARKRPTSSELLREVRDLRARGYKNGVIAEKLGMDGDYIDSIVRLIERGEDNLVERVEAGSLPISVAIKIATSRSDEVQRALSDAYDKGELRGAKLRVVQRIITQRTAKTRAITRPESQPSTSTKDLVREYERHTLRQRTLIRRASLVNERLTILCASLKRLLDDPQFVALLQATALNTMPEELASRLV